ncbi:MAG: T9SS type A sorting domain-containing protein, partial [Bacteroidota bacterium]
HAGYKGGGIEIPTVSNEFMISPISGDNTAHIQAAIDEAALLPKDELGTRGAVLLSAGRYEIHGILNLRHDGVILRGAGDGEDPALNTILVGVGNTPNQRDIIVAGGGRGTAWSGMLANTKTNILSDKVLVGENNFRVENSSPYEVGDNIIIYHPCTQTWLEAIDGGGTGSEPNWSVGSQPLVFNRRITNIQDSIITVDVPLYNQLDRSLSQSYIYKYDREGLITQVGIENLRIDIETAGGDDEAHAWNAVKLKQVEDAWVKNCTFLHFGLAGVATETATRITIENCQALDPVAQVTGGRMYNFNLLKASSQVLVKDCYASNGRHHYVSNGTSWVSGCVFLRSISDAAYTSSEGHRRWSMGLLYDKHVELNVRSNRLRLLALYNRGDFGTAHGWSAVHSVAWNCDVSSGLLVVEKPPTAQNYAIGCSGSVEGNGPFNKEIGYVEGANTPGILPESLYEAQLFARLNGLASTTITTSLKKNRDQLRFLLYPNPTKGVINIDLRTSESFAEQASVEVYNSIGQLVKTDAFRFQVQMDVSSLSKGVYVVFLKQGQKQAIRRVVVE